jgi:hypothetical protein
VRGGLVVEGAGEGARAGGVDDEVLVDAKHVGRADTALFVHVLPALAHLCVCVCVCVCV